MTTKKDTKKTEPVGALERMRLPFDKSQIGKLAKGSKAQMQCKANEKVNCKICGGWHHPKLVHLDYVGHAALTDRLLDCDLGWDWEPMALTAEGLPRFDESGGLWIKLTVDGITRLGYGHAPTSQYKSVGDRDKEVIGDALRNAAMRFGAALELWHKGDWHAQAPPEDESGLESNSGPSEDSGPKSKSGKKEFKDYFAKLKTIGNKSDYIAWWKDANIQMQEDLSPTQYNAMKEACTQHAAEFLQAAKEEIASDSPSPEEAP